MRRYVIGQCAVRAEPFSDFGTATFFSGSEGDDDFEADMARQLIAAGWWRDHAGYHPEWVYGPKPADTRCDCPEHRLPAQFWSYGPHAGERYDAG